MDNDPIYFDDDLEDILNAESLLGIDLRCSGQLFDDLEEFDAITTACSSPCDEQSVPNNPHENDSNDIPTNRNEWLVIDQASRRRRPPRLYEFLILLLHKPQYASYAYYKDKSLGLFEITQPDQVAALWQQVKNRQANQDMTYDKFARAIRWYYKTDIMKKTNARYTFQFSSRTLEAIVVDENNNITINSPV